MSGDFLCLFVAGRRWVTFLHDLPECFGVIVGGDSVVLGWSFCVILALVVMASSSLVLKILKCCWIGRRAWVGRVQGVLLVCLMDADLTFAPVGAAVSAAFLFFRLLFRSPC